MTELGVFVERTVPGESAQNAAAERMIGVLTEKARVLLLQSGASRGFWAEAFLYACWLNNLLAHRRLGWRSPADVLFGTPVRADMIKPFGCAAFVKLPDGANKLGARASKCVLLGIDPQAKGWRVWDSQAKRVFVRWNVKFVETDFPWVTKSLVGGGSCFDDDDDVGPTPALPSAALPAPVLPLAPALPAPALPAPALPAPALQLLLCQLLFFLLLLLCKLRLLWLCMLILSMLIKQEVMANRRMRMRRRPWRSHRRGDCTSLPVSCKSWCSSTSLRRC